MSKTEKSEKEQKRESEGFEVPVQNDTNSGQY